MSAPWAPWSGGSELPDEQCRWVDSLRADLAAADYTVAGVDDLLGVMASAALHREESVPALLTTTTADLRAVLVRAFVLGAPVPRAAMAAALPRLGVDGAERLGLVVASGNGPDDSIRAAVDLRPYAAAAETDVDWWIASDLGELATGGALRTDHVLGVGGASATLAQVTVRDQRTRALDLGTGCGIQALHAAQHCGSVLGTDISARALGFARFNAVLAGVSDRIDLRLGSMLEPAAGQTFDLIVSNPPFVITPRRADIPEYEYRDGGRSGDDLVRDLIGGVGVHLAPGGVAQLLGNWEIRSGQSWDERIGEWLDSAGSLVDADGGALDAWVIQREVLDPAQYAETWIRDGGTTPERDRAGWQARYAAWLEDMASRDVDGVGFGIVTLRRRGARSVAPALPTTATAPTLSTSATPPSPPLRRLEEVTGTIQMPLGPVLLAGLQADDWLRANAEPPAAIGAHHLAVAGDVTEERYLTPGASDPQIVLLRQGSGLGRTVRADTVLAGVVGACDGDLSVDQIIAAIASIIDVAPDAVAEQVIPQVIGLVRDGLLVAEPVTDPA